MRFFQTASMPTAHSVKMCVHAPAGYGKSMLAATTPRPLLVTVEGGTLSLSPKNIAAAFGPNRQDVCYNIPGIEIANLVDLTQAYMFIRTSAEMRNFDTVNIDSLTEIAEKVLAGSKAVNKDGRAAYGEMQDRVVQIIRDFRDLPDKHVYFSAKQEREQDAASGLMLFGPMMPGKYLTQNLAYFFDEVFALTISPPDATGKSQRSLLTRSNNQYSAKDRSGALAEYEPCHLGTVIAKIQNYVLNA